MEIVKVQFVRTRDDYFTKLSYGNETSEEFDIIRGSIAWPHESIPGLMLIGGLQRGTEVIKVTEETLFKTLPEAKRLVLDYKAKYSRSLYCIYYQNTYEGEGYVKYLKGRDEYFKPYLTPAPYSESIDYGIQLASACLDDNKLKVPGGGLLATQLQTGWENISSEKRLHGVIALACLIAGIEARFEGSFLSEVEHEGLRDLPSGLDECRSE